MIISRHSHRAGFPSTASAFAASAIAAMSAVGLGAEDSANLLATNSAPPTAEAAPNTGAPAATPAPLAALPTPPAAVPAGEGDADAPAALRLREGTQFTDRAGRFRQHGESLTFVDDEGRELGGLPNLNLERVIRMLKTVEEPEAISWSVSGAVTEFGGRNYLLDQPRGLQGGDPAADSRSRGVSDRAFFSALQSTRSGLPVTRNWLRDLTLQPSSI